MTPFPMAVNRMRRGLPQASPAQNGGAGLADVGRGSRWLDAIRQREVPGQTSIRPSAPIGRAPTGAAQMAKNGTAAAGGLGMANGSDAEVVQRKDFWSDARDGAVGFVEDVFDDPLRATLAIGTGGLSELAFYGPATLAAGALALPPQDMSGTDALRELYRRDYLNFVRGWPMEDELVGSYRNLGDRREAQSQAVADVNQSFDMAQAGLRDRMGRYGLAMTPEQSSEQQRRSDHARGLAEVEAINRTSRRMDDRDRELMTVGVTPRRFT